MKKHFLILFLLATIPGALNAQSRGVRIGYIDMEYILEKVPNYAEANNQLELKAQKWKQDAEVKRNEINKLKENLKTERVLLTKELIEEREEEISFLETDLLDFQQKRFGSTGDLMTQKAVLVKPIQDQVFTIVQDIATAKKYDFIFDKSSDLTMLFSAQQHNISDQVVRQLVRAEKREQLSSKQLKEEAEQERKQDLIDSNPELSERQKLNEEKKTAREKLIEERKLAADAKKQEYAERRAKLLEEREAKRNAAKDGKTAEPKEGAKGEDIKTSTEEKTSNAAANIEEKKAAAEQARENAAIERQKKLDERKAALEEKRKRILEEREAAKKEKEEKKNNPATTTPPAGEN
ncbi:OmpH family outer membrane protein [Flavobacterium qiangtangense]|uniref:OmpH family outer membrane protein n=1 Tax=Flavobacterium qiangtangense TaxID=1442595 RepID=A0ABW1PSV4_9FLAO